MIPWRTPRSTIAARPVFSSSIWARRPSAQRRRRSPPSSRRDVASGNVARPLGPVTMICEGGTEPAAIRPTTSTVSSATIAERSRGKTRSTCGPRSTEAPSHARAARPLFEQTERRARRQRWRRRSVRRPRRGRGPSRWPCRRRRRRRGRRSGPGEAASRADRGGRRGRARPRSASRRRCTRPRRGALDRGSPQPR